MTTSAMRGSGIVLLGCLIGACTRIGHIQKTEPVRMMTFKNPHTAVAQCIQQRLRGRMQTDEAGRLVIFDSARSQQADGLTHYSVTVGPASEGGGFAEWRILSSQTTGSLSEAAIQQYWGTVQSCAANPKLVR